MRDMDGTFENLRLCQTLCENCINFTLLLLFNAFLDEDIGDGDPHDDGENDGDTGDTEPQRFKKLPDGDCLDMQNRKE